MSSLIKGEVRPVIVGACGGACPGDLRPVVADRAWQADKCGACGGSWWHQVPRPLAEIDAAVKAEAERREALKGAS